MREQADPNTVNSSVGKGRKYLTERRSRPRLATGPGAECHIVPAAKLHDIGLSDRRRHQSQKLDRPVRCFHPRDHRRDARPRYYFRGVSWSARARFQFWCARGSRLSQIRFRRGNALLDGETLRALYARERLVAVGVDLSGGAR